MLFSGSINDNKIEVQLDVGERENIEGKSYYFPRFWFDFVSEEFEICDSFEYESDAWFHGRQILEQMGFEEIK